MLLVIWEFFDGACRTAKGAGPGKVGFGSGVQRAPKCAVLQVIFDTCVIE